MKHVKKTVLLWYSPAEIYSLVTSVGDYPQFLPWCKQADILEVHGGGMTAKLHLMYAGVRQAFTTRNTHTPHHTVVVDLVDGPFSVLNGTWRFLPLANAPSPDTCACKVEFDLKYEFSNTAFELLLSPVFDRIANTFVDSFVKRAEQVYGQR
jgi:ribosome-associated toxin RatA of RatAB toxin-antitoxin module